MVKFSTFRHLALFYRARKILRNGIKLHIDLRKKRFNVFLDAQYFVQGKENVKYAYADFNCNLKIRFSDNDEKIFPLMGKLKITETATRVVL